MSSCSTEKETSPARTLSRILPSPSMIFSDSSGVRMPQEPNMRAWAMLPRISSSTSRRSKSMEAVNSSTNRSVFLVNLPPHSFFTGFLLSPVNLGIHLCRQPPQLDETHRRLMIEGILRRIGGQLFIVQGTGRPAAGHRGVSLEQADPYGPGHGFLGFPDGRVQGLLQRRIPQPLIYQTRRLLLHYRREMGHLAGLREEFQLTMGRKEGHRRGTFVPFPGLDAHEPVRHVIDPADAVLPGSPIEAGDQFMEAQRHPGQGHRHPPVG